MMKIGIIVSGKIRKGMGEMLTQYLEKEAIHCGCTAKDWKEAIRLAAEPLLKSGKIEERYVDRAISKVEELGPYIVLTHGVAVAHARPKEDVKKGGISLVTLKEPIPFGHKSYDPVSLVFMLAATTDDGHIGVMMSVAQALCEPNVKERIIAAKSAEEIYQIIVQHN